MNRFIFIPRKLADAESMFSDGMISHVDRKPPDTDFGATSYRPIYLDTYQGFALRTIRKELKMTLRDAAKKMEISASDLSKVERGALIFKHAVDFAHALYLLFPGPQPCDNGGE